MGRFHLDSNGVPKPCKAQKKCPYGDIVEDHFFSKEEARERFELLQSGKTIPRNPINVLPRVHRDPSGSDAFYNLKGEVTDETLEALASFQYFHKIQVIDSFRKDLEETVADAKGMIKKLPGGDYYEGWSLIRPNLEAEDFQKIPERTISKDSEFPPADCPREVAVNSELIANYLNDSLDFYRNLTPEEQNAVAYWTGAGSTVAATCVYGNDNPWSIQSSNPLEETYFDVDGYLGRMDSALEKAELKNSKLLYRGLNEEIIGDDLVHESFRKQNGTPLLDSWLENNYKPGTTIHFDIPQSSTLEPRRSLQFADGQIVLEIKAKRAGATGVLGAWGAGETEYLLPRDTGYRVISVEKDVNFPRIDRRTGEKLADSVVVIQLEQI